jgi:hypothetical protein
LYAPYIGMHVCCFRRRFLGCLAGGHCGQNSRIVRRSRWSIGG